MPVNLENVRAGDKVLMRDGSKVTINEYEGELRVILQPLECWQNDGVWSPFNRNCKFDIVGVIYGKRKIPEAKDNAS